LGNENCIEIVIENLKGRDHLGDVGADGRMFLK
jgi:hypothetical protein